MNRSNVDAYLRDGCGRCDRYQTPACKVHRSAEALGELRAMLLAEGLDEQLKWGSPCYTDRGRNVVMLGALVDSCVLSFFRGAELIDDAGLLEAPGPNSHHARLLRFRSAAEVRARRAQAAHLVRQAVALERSGAKPRASRAPEPMPAELAERLARDPALAQAFEALTPGRRRSHLLHVAGATQTETRARRAERCAAKIAAGKGFNER